MSDRVDWKDWILEKNVEFKEEQLNKSDSIVLEKGSRSRKKDKLKGGKGDSKSDSDFDAKQVKAGHKVEMEHTKSPDVAAEIARDHLAEDPKYYSKLKQAGLADELEKAKIYDMKGKLLDDTPSDLWPTPKVTFGYSDRGDGVGEIINPATYKAPSEVAASSAASSSKDEPYMHHKIMDGDRHVANLYVSNPKAVGVEPHHYVEHLTEDPGLKNKIESFALKSRQDIHAGIGGSAQPQVKPKLS